MIFWKKILVNEMHEIRIIKGETEPGLYSRRYVKIYYTLESQDRDERKKDQN